MKDKSFSGALQRLLCDHADGLMNESELRHEVGVEVERWKPVQATCIYCGKAFTPPKPTTTMCRFCWFGGKHYESSHAAMFDGLRAIPGVESASIDHTGGGCFNLAIRFADKRFLCGTLAYQEDTGVWSCDAGIPEPGTPWALSVYGDEDVEFTAGNELEPLRLPLTDDELVEAVRESAGRARPVVTLVETPPPSSTSTRDEDACPFCGWADDWREMATRGHSIDVWCSHCGGIVQAG